MAKKIRVWDGTSWQQVGISAALPSAFNEVISGNTTIEAGRRYFVDTSAARTLTLPSSASAGDTIEIYDSTGEAGTNNITVSRNSNLINGLEEDAIIDVDQSISILVYTGATLGWRFE
jgi:hypothetical protein